MSERRSQRRHAIIEDGQLVIKIGIDTLAFAFENREENLPWDDEKLNYIQKYRVVDKDQFAKDVRDSMMDEREDGSTPLTDFLDKLYSKAIDDGNLGVDEVDEKDNVRRDL